MSKKVGLTDVRIVGLLPPKIGQIEITDSIVPGLRLRVGASGVKTYILRKRIGSKVHNVTLGRHSLGFGLAAARGRARDLLTDIEQGLSIPKRSDPNRGYAQGIGTIGELFETYLSNEVIGKKRSAREIERVFRKHILPDLAGGETMAWGRLRICRLPVPATQRQCFAVKFVRALTPFAERRMSRKVIRASRKRHAIVTKR
ncbi:MAG: hypothetical protein RL481_2145 [Pseudomonadota bacterium]